MSDHRSFRRPLLILAALLFGSATILYSALWMYFQHWQTPVQLGFDTEYVTTEHSQVLTRINKDSAAEKAGLKAGDRILKVDGERFETATSLMEIWNRHKPGDTVELTVQRPNVPAPLVIKAVFRARLSPPLEGGIPQHLSQGILDAFPLPFLIVGLAVLFLRLQDPKAWLLAAMFASWIAAPGLGGIATVSGESLRAFAMAYRAIFNGLLGGLFFLFFAVFPQRSPLDRRAGWLKWLGLALGLSMAVPGLALGNPRVPAVAYKLMGESASGLWWGYNYGFIALGLISLVWNAFSAATPEVRPKIRVMVWGTLVGVAPVVMMAAALDILGFRPPFWLVAGIVLLLFLFPASFAYAVVKHRVMEIPLLLKRSARYLLVQRGFIFLTVIWGTGFTGLFISVASKSAHLLPWNPQVALWTAGGAAVAFGSLLALAGVRLHEQATLRIDRAFFRSAYDARVILEELAERVRTVGDRRELAALLEGQILSALHPRSLAIYFESSPGVLAVQTENLPAHLATLATNLKELAEVARQGSPWDVPVGADGTPQLPSLAGLQPECLVPMLGREGRLIGLLVLGPRLSEETYSGEDKRLLASVACQAGIALENIRLAEQIALRLEAEHRAALEMEIAKQVQSNLLPQRLPELATLEYAGQCIQAREVGGDYYDFLDLGPGRMGFVLADVAGKGISAALLMANLQANLRSVVLGAHRALSALAGANLHAEMRNQFAVVLKNLPGLLTAVNRLFYESTPGGRFATLFLGDYDDSTRRLHYVNCGHNPPILLHRDGTLERLQPTATVLGLFEDWKCSIEVADLAPGDLLVLFSDGVTEAADDQGEEFGETRLLEVLGAYRHQPCTEMLQNLIRDVQRFSGSEQEDDLTLLVARVR